MAAMDRARSPVGPPGDWPHSLRCVPADLRERVFEPFFRVDDHVSGSGGTGLGLSMSRRLAETHGGSLTIADTPAGGRRSSSACPAPAGKAPPTPVPRLRDNRPVTSQ
jgi:hypothetical protein